MFKLIRLITLHPDAGEADRQSLIAAIAACPSAARARLAPTGTYVVNGGDLHWHVLFHAEADYRAWLRAPEQRAAQAALAAHPVIHVDEVSYWQGSTVLGEPNLAGGIHRTLILALRPGMAPARIAQFEAEMREMARYVPAIRNWSFSPVTHAAGARTWTHVWEQEFRSEADLNGPYMMHPIHFASIDRWFDTQSHDWLIDTHLCHSYCPMTGSMIAPPLASG